MTGNKGPLHYLEDKDEGKEYQGRAQAGAGCGRLKSHSFDEGNAVSVNVSDPEESATLPPMVVPSAKSTTLLPAELP